MRIGIGYDVHRFDAKRPLKLGGVTIPAPRGLAGHSDADVLLHAVADALFGAIGAPDLGEQFPPNDPRYRHADSRMFVKAASAQIRRRGLAVANLDTTVIANAPKLVRYKPAICRAIARMLDVGADQISVKAKTTEGFAPGGKGIAAQAVVLLMKRSPSGRPVASRPRRLSRHSTARRSS